MYLYIMQMQLPEGVPPMYKIGVSTNHPSQRRKDLQTGNAFPIIILWYSELEQLATVVERVLHDTLSQCQGEGEWFQVNKSFIDELTRSLPAIINEDVIRHYDALNDELTRAMRQVEDMRVDVRDRLTALVTDILT